MPVYVVTLPATDPDLDRLIADRFGDQAHRLGPRQWLIAAESDPVALSTLLRDLADRPLRGLLTVPVEPETLAWLAGRG